MADNVLPYADALLRFGMGLLCAGFAEPLAFAMRIILLRPRLVTNQPIVCGGHLYHEAAVWTL